MSTSLLTDVRQRTTPTHPPDAGDRQLLAIPDHTARRRLPPSDRLSLLLGLWLLQRGLRTHRTADVSAHCLRLVREQAAAEYEAVTRIGYDMQRGLR